MRTSSPFTPSRTGHRCRRSDSKAASIYHPPVTVAGSAGTHGVGPRCPSVALDLQPAERCRAWRWIILRIRFTFPPVDADSSATECFRSTTWPHSRPSHREVREGGRSECQCTGGPRPGAASTTRAYDLIGPTRQRRDLNAVNDDGGIYTMMAPEPSSARSGT